MSAGDGMVSAGLTGMGLGAREAAASLLGTLANDVLVLRMPQPPVGDSDAEELGLGSPQFADVTLKPVLVQQRGAKTLVTLSADALETALGVEAPNAVETAVRSAMFAAVGDRVLQVEAVERRAVFGRAYLYRLLLIAPKLG